MAWTIKDAGSWGIATTDTPSDTIISGSTGWVAGSLLLKGP
jgi:hypothetical protein